MWMSLARVLAASDMIDVTSLMMPGVSSRSFSASTLTGTNWARDSPRPDVVSPSSAPLPIAWITWLRTDDGRPCFSKAFRMALSVARTGTTFIPVVNATSSTACQSKGLAMASLIPPLSPFRGKISLFLANSQGTSFRLSLDASRSSAEANGIDSCVARTLATSSSVTKPMLWRIFPSSSLVCT